jgi:hypothetical protein
MAERERRMRRRRTDVALKVRMLVLDLQYLIRMQGAMRSMRTVGRDASI